MSRSEPDWRIRRHDRKRAREACGPLAYLACFLGLLAAWLCRKHWRSANTFENTTEIAIGGNNGRSVVLKCGASYIKTAQEKVKVLGVRRAVGAGVNTRCLRVGLAFNL